VLQCVAVCCSVLQCVAVCCSVLQCVCNVLQCIVVCCSVLKKLTTTYSGRHNNNFSFNVCVCGVRVDHLREEDHIVCVCVWYMCQQFLF